MGAGNPLPVVSSRRHASGQLQGQPGLPRAALSGQQRHTASWQRFVNQPLPGLGHRVPPGRHPQRVGRLNRPGQCLQRPPQVGLRQGHRLPEAGRFPFHAAAQHRQGFTRALVALVGQPARLDIVGQRHQLQQRLRLRVRRQFHPLEDVDLVVAIGRGHAGTSSISSAA